MKKRLKNLKIERKSEYFLLLIILAICIIIRIIYAIYFSPKTLTYDAAVYDTIARNIVSGRGFWYIDLNHTVCYLPVYPYFLSIFYFFCGHNLLLIKLLQAIIDSLTCIMIYFIGKKAFNSKIGFLAGLIYAIYIPFAFSSSIIRTETLFIFLFTLSVLLLLKAIEKESLFNYFFSGIFLGASLLTRRVTLLFPLVILALILVVKKKRWKFFKGFIILMVGLILALTPWLIYTYHLIGTPVPVPFSGGVSFLIKEANITPLQVGAPSTEEKAASSFDKLKQYGKTMIHYGKFYGQKLYQNWRYPYVENPPGGAVATNIITLLHFLILFFSVFGIIFSLRFWRKPAIFILILSIAYFVITSFSGIPFARLVFPILPLMIIFASHGIYRTVEEFKSSRKKMAIIFSTTIFIILCISFYFLKKGEWSNINYIYLHYTEATIKIAILISFLSLLNLVFLQKLRKNIKIICQIVLILILVLTSFYLLTEKSWIEWSQRLSDENYTVRRIISLPEKIDDYQSFFLRIRLKSGDGDKFKFQVSADSVVVGSYAYGDLPGFGDCWLEIPLNKEAIKNNKEPIVEARVIGKPDNLLNYIDILGQPSLNNNSSFFNGLRWSSVDLSTSPGRQFGGYLIELKAIKSDGREVLI